MGSHQSTRSSSDEWLTPPYLIEALGPFDLDPCAPIDPPWRTATRQLTVADDGLTADWGAHETVWLNPPYSTIWQWMARLAEHPAGGIALIFARTETKGFYRRVWRPASALYFLQGRLHFHRPDGERAKANAGAPSVLVAYGEAMALRLAARSQDGSLGLGALVQKWDAHS